MVTGIVTNLIQSEELFLLSQTCKVLVIARVALIKERRTRTPVIFTISM
jgi:hypothetical protein